MTAAHVTWDPPLDLVGDRELLTVSATDVASRSPCGRYLALKTRPKVKSPSWSRVFPPREGNQTPFPLADVVELVLEAHQSPETNTDAGLRSWLIERMNERDLNRLVRPYVERAVQNVLEAHESIEADIGALRLLTKNPVFGRVGRTLTAWAPLYVTENGAREIRRLRVGSVHDEPDEDDLRWAATAGYVAASLPASAPCARVRVVEVGPVDGSIAVLFDGTPDEAKAAYASDSKAHVAALVEKDHVVPCTSCGDCKVAGVCEALVPLDGMLGQPGRGHRSRSVSPSALEQYARCPAQWLLDSWLHLPKDKGTTEAQARGYAVHEWLRVAHERGVACQRSDLSEPGGDLGLVEGQMAPEDYEAAHPFLVHHVAHCPLEIDGTTLVSTEENVHGFDHDAQVVAVTKPDMVYRRDDRLVIREVKTSKLGLDHGKDEAYGKYLQVPFLLQLLATGLLEQYGCTAGTVELELLTAEGQQVWAWDTEDPTTMLVAQGDVRRAVDDWHTDDVWMSRPGPHCVWCPIRVWCPDRDVYADASVGSTGGSWLGGGTADEEAPF